MQRMYIHVLRKYQNIRCWCTCISYGRSAFAAGADCTYIVVKSRLDDCATWNAIERNPEAILRHACYIYAFIYYNVSRLVGEQI